MASLLSGGGCGCDTFRYQEVGDTLKGLEGLLWPVAIKLAVAPVASLVVADTDTLEHPAGHRYTTQDTLHKI